MGLDSQKEQQYKDALRAARSTILDLQKDLAQKNAAPQDQATAKEPIAIIGLSCLFPGMYPEDATTPEAFHQQLVNGVDSVTDLPADRRVLWNACHVEHSAAKTSFISKGAFLGRNIHSFDCGFFNIPPAESRMTDPQHRLFLELVWRALEDAGIKPEDTAATQTGIFAGKSGTDFMFDLLGTGKRGADDPYTMTGNMHSALPGRISYFFDWYGPSLSYETACSTSLVAIMGAVSALRAQDCSLALAGAVNLLAGPTPSHWLNAMHALAPDGRSKAFGAAADGFGRGEGGGVVVLKRLSDAERDKDRIHAVILGGAIGSDGHSRSFSAPNSRGQRAVISRALADAGINPQEVAFVETHGTGTPIGDPIEVESLCAVYGEREQPLLIGSVKSNIGHLEGACGMAALVKTVAAVRHGVVHKSLHAEPLNPLLDWANLPVEVNTRLRDWPEGYARRVAGISSFAIAGTLGHLLVAEAPKTLPKSEASEELTLSSRVLPLSAQSAEDFPQMAQTCRKILQQGASWAELCGAAGTLRTHFPERLALRADNAEEGLAALDSFLQGKTRRGSYQGKAGGNSGEQALPLLFLFSGQGSQKGGMGRDLYAAFPDFRAVLDRCEAIAAPFLGHSLLEIMFAENDARLDETRVTQPAIFSHQVALAELLRQRGVKPANVLGHSIGEYAAAVSAGIMSLETGLVVALKRGELAGQIATKGSMAAVLGAEEKVKALLQRFPSVSIAAVNGPETVTIAGEEEAVEQALLSLREAGLESRTMPVSHAFHCALIEPALETFTVFLRTQTFFAPKIPFLSGCTGEVLAAEQDWPAYFVRQTRQPVQFSKALLAAPEEVFLEIGAGPTLSAYGRQCRNDGLWLFTQNESGGRNQERHLAQALAKLYTLGHIVNWDWLATQERKPELAPGVVFHPVDLTPEPDAGLQAVAQAQPEASAKAQAQDAGQPATQTLSLAELSRMQCEAFTQLCATQNLLLAGSENDDVDI